MIPEWAMAAAFLLLAAIFIMLFLIHKRLNKRIKVNKPSDFIKKESKRPLEDLAAQYEEKRGEDLAAYFQNYVKMLAKMDIPPDALTARKCTCVFSLEHAALSHYVWRRDGNLCFFPKWRDISLSILSSEYIPATDGSERGMIFGWAIPLDYINYYVIDEINAVTTVYYEDKSGKRYKTVFLEGGGRAFKKLLPEKNYDLVKRREYLGSYGNILEMDEAISQLKIKKEQGLISGQEYEVQKEQVMRNL